MNGFDLGSGLVIAAALSLGAVLGIMRIALGTVSLIAGAASAALFAERGSVLLQPWIKTASVATLVAFFGVFGCVLILFAVFGWLLRKSLKVLGLGWLDRLAGGVLAIVTVMLAIGPFAFVVSERAPDSELVRSSVLVEPFAMLTERALDYAPPAFRERLDALAGEDEDGLLDDDALEDGVEPEPGR